MNAKLIKTEEAHKAALAHVETLMDAEPGSPQEDELELWSLLVEQYEKEHFPMEDPDPIEAIRFRMDQLGLHQKDLVRFIGQKSKVSEVLNRRRKLSLPMIRSLHNHLGISAAVLVRAVPTVKSKKPKSSSSRGKSIRSKATTARPKLAKRQSASIL